MTDLSPLAGFLAQNDWVAAERLLRRAARDKRASAMVFYNLAKVLEAQGKTGQRESWLKRALAVDAAHDKAWFELGRVRLETRDLPGAERAFAKAVVLSPQDLDGWRQLLRIRLRVGDWAGAEEVLAQLPDDGETRSAIYRIGCETGRDMTPLRARLLADPHRRMEALKVLTRVAKGAVPLRLPKV